MAIKLARLFQKLNPSRALGKITASQEPPHSILVLAANDLEAVALLPIGHNGHEPQMHYAPGLAAFIIWASVVGKYTIFQYKPADLVAVDIVGPLFHKASVNRSLLMR